MTEPVPVLVELFTSEGCSSCPPADALLARLLDEQPVRCARIIGLGEHVDYWNDLGWADPFSSPEFTRRQFQYVRRFGSDSPYTPQAVIGGWRQVLGSSWRAVTGAVADACRATQGSITLNVRHSSDGRVVLDVDPGQPSGRIRPGAWRRTDPRRLLDGTPRPVIQFRPG